MSLLIWIVGGIFCVALICSAIEGITAHRWLRKHRPDLLKHPRAR